MTKSRWPRIKHYKRRLGALERRSFKLVRQKQFLRTPWGDGLALFHRPGEIAEHLRRFEELGLADLLEAPDARCDDDEEIWDRMWKQAGKMAG